MTSNSGGEEETDYYGYLSYLSSIRKEDDMLQDMDKRVDVQNNASAIQLDERSIFAGDFSPPFSSSKGEESSDSADVLTGCSSPSIGRKASHNETIYFDSMGRPFNPITLTKALPLTMVPSPSKAASTKLSSGTSINTTSQGGNLHANMQGLAERLALLNKRDKKRNNVGNTGGTSSNGSAPSFNSLLPVCSPPIADYSSHSCSSQSNSHIFGSDDKTPPSSFVVTSASFISRSAADNCQQPLLPTNGGGDASNNSVARREAAGTTSSVPTSTGALQKRIDVAAFSCVPGILPLVASMPTSLVADAESVAFEDIDLDLDDGYAAFLEVTSSSLAGVHNKINKLPLTKSSDSTLFSRDRACADEESETKKSQSNETGEGDSAATGTAAGLGIDIQPCLPAQDNITKSGNMSSSSRSNSLPSLLSPITVQKVSSTSTLSSSSSTSSLVSKAQQQQLGTRTAAELTEEEDDDASVDVTAAVQSLKNIPVNMFHHPLDNKAIESATYLASEAAHLVNQYAVQNTKDTLMGNYYTSSFIGCMSETFYFVLDRAKTTVNQYLGHLHADDPERIHLERIKTSSQWHYLMLRYSMASLTWKQRQIIEETRENHELTANLFNSGHTPDCEHLLMERKQQLSQITGDGASSGDRRTQQQQQQQQHLYSGTSSAAIRTPIETFVESNIHAWLINDASNGNEDAQYALARYFTAPAFALSKRCNVVSCRARFGIGLFRHHCRFCGQSVCEKHSTQRRCIFRFGLTEPVRVCDACAFNIDEVHRRDQLLWREARLRAYFNRRLLPYVNTALDRGVDKMLRIAEGTFVVAKTTLYYSMPAQIVLETISILRRYGLSGFAGLMLRQDFMESVETLKRISGMDNSLLMSLHELTACIYYKLAIDRGLRGCNPDSELIAHAPHSFVNTSFAGKNTTAVAAGGVAAAASVAGSTARSSNGKSRDSSSGREKTDTDEADFECKPASDKDISTAIRYAPLALKIVYENTTLDAQRLSRSLGWDLIFTNVESEPAPEQPVYMLFGTSFGGVRETAAGGGGRGGGGGAKQPTRTAVLAIRGTVTVQDVVTDIRAAPAAFPPSVAMISAALCGLPQFDSNIADSDDMPFTMESDTSPEQRAAATSATAPNDDAPKQAGDVNTPACTLQQNGEIVDSDNENGIEDVDMSSLSSRVTTAAPKVTKTAGAGAGPKEWDWLVVTKNKRKQQNKVLGGETAAADEEEEDGEENENGDDDDDDDYFGESMPKCSYACVGMIRSAMYILREVGPSLLQLHREGYAIKLCGHSLGGCVSALLSYLLLRAELPSLDKVSSGRKNPFFNRQAMSSISPHPLSRQSSAGPGSDIDAKGLEPVIELDIYKGLYGIPCETIAYGSPSCVDAAMSDLLSTRCGVINVILHDDVLCRITPASIRNLKKELSLFRKEVFHHMQQDFYDVLYRAASLWSPRQRQTHPGWFPSHPAGATGQVLTASISYSSKRNLKDGDIDSSDSEEAETPPHTPHNIGKKFPVRPIVIDDSKDEDVITLEDVDGVLVEEGIMPELWLPGKIIHLFCNRGQFHASEVSRTFPDIRRIDVQADIFQDHLSLNIFNALLEVRAVRQTHSGGGASDPVPSNVTEPVYIISSNIPSMPNHPPPPVPGIKPAPLIPLAPPRAPIVHVSKYVSEFDKATTAAANGSSSFRAMNQSSPSSSTVKTSASVAASGGASAALAPEMMASTRSKQPLPWEPFDARDDCHCCGNSFTWHSTFQGDAQEYRERYNCRHCGRLVCGPCSTEKRPIPKWGMIFPKRICDMCVNAGEFGNM